MFQKTFFEIVMFFPLLFLHIACYLFNSNLYLYLCFNFHFYLFVGFIARRYFYIIVFYQ